MLSVTTRGRMSAAGALAAGLLVAASVSGSTVSATAAAPSPAVQQCAPGAGSSAARVAHGSTAAEPKLYPDNEAKAYGVLPDAPYLGNGSVTIRTVFHMISDDGFTAAEKAR